MADSYVMQYAVIAHAATVTAVYTTSQLMSLQMLPYGTKNDFAELRFYHFSHHA